MTNEYELTSKIYGGAVELQPGDVVELDPEVYENSQFWKSRAKPVAGELKPAKEKEPAKLPTIPQGKK